MENIGGPVKRSIFPSIQSLPFLRVPLIMRSHNNRLCRPLEFASWPLQEDPRIDPQDSIFVSKKRIELQFFDLGVFLNQLRNL